MNSNKFYTVWVGHECGVFSSWKECEKQIKGYSGAKFRRFTKEEDAIKAFNEGLDESGLKTPTKKDIETGAYKLPDIDDFVKSGGVVIFTDGSLIHGKLGPDYDRETDINIGGYGALLLHKLGEKKISGYERDTTISRMEMKACIEAIKCLKVKSKVCIISDSGYVINTINMNWKRKKNKDLWSEIDSLIEDHDLSFNWTGGHSGVEGNEVADKLATEASRAVRDEEEGLNSDIDEDEPHLINI